MVIRARKINFYKDVIGLLEAVAELLGRALERFLANIRNCCPRIQAIVHIVAHFAEAL
jgi:hypothetical protein